MIYSLHEARASGLYFVANLGSLAIAVKFKYANAGPYGINAQLR